MARQSRARHRAFLMPGKKRKGRPQVVSDTTIRRALERGATPNQIADLCACTGQTIRRRIKEARKKHGDAWGTCINPQTPTPEPAQAAVLAVDPNEPEPTRAEMLRLAKLTLVRAMQYGKQPDRVTAAKIVLSNPPEATPPPKREESREALRDRVNKATTDAAPKLELVEEPRETRTPDTSDTVRTNVSKLPDGE